MDKKRIASVSAAFAAVAIIVGGVAWGATAASQPVDEPTRSVRIADVPEDEPTVTPTPTVEPTIEPAPVTEVPAEPAPEQPAPAPQPVAPAPAPPAPAPAPEPYVPVKCPAGTTPGQVDGNGDESMCQAPCQEWIDTDGDGTAETCGRP